MNDSAARSRRGKRALALAGLMLSALTIAPPTSHAFRYKSSCGSKLTWADEDIRWSAGSSSFPSSGPRRQALRDAIKIWNDGPGDFDFLSPSWGDGKVKRHNGDEEIWYTDDHDLTNGRPGIALSWFACYFSEVDILFYNPEKWSYSDVRSTKTSYGGEYRPWITAALHEMGHSFGLNHVSTEYNIMGSDSTHLSTNAGKVRYSAGEDGHDGQVYLYGTSGGQDIGVTHWKYGGVTETEYSKHVLTTITAPSLPSVPSATFEGVKRYDVIDNLDYGVQFTYENNGKNQQDGIDVGFYISTNETITTKDLLIASGTINLSRDDANTIRSTIHLPQLTVGQTYWLGVIVDRTNAIAEVDETNNATYIPIQVTCCD